MAAAASSDRRKSLLERRHSPERWSGPRASARRAADARRTIFAARFRRKGPRVKALPTSFLFVVLMSLLGALSAFATDMSLPATGPMARDLAVTPGGGRPRPVRLYDQLRRVAAGLRPALRPLWASPRRPLRLPRLHGGQQRLRARRQPARSAVLALRAGDRRRRAATGARHDRRPFQGRRGAREDVLRQRAQPARPPARADDRRGAAAARRLAADLRLSHRDERGGAGAGLDAARRIAAAGAPQRAFRARGRRPLPRHLPLAPLACPYGDRDFHVWRDLQLRQRLAAGDDRRL